MAGKQLKGEVMGQEEHFKGTKKMHYRTELLCVGSAARSTFLKSVSEYIHYFEKHQQKTHLHAALPSLLPINNGRARAASFRSNQKPHALLQHISLKHH